jgi:putative endonuclease
MASPTFVGPSQQPWLSFLTLRNDRSRDFQVFRAGSVIAISRSMSGALCFVYIIRSRSNTSRYYTGVTSHVAARLAAHNAGRCTHTARFRPWQLVVSIEFADERRAMDFEKYLKSGSGVAFAQRHLR